MAAPPHFQRCLGDGQWIADAPIAGAVHPKALISVHLGHINSACRRTLGLGIECHSRPHPGVEHQFYGVLLDMIDDDTFGPYAFIILERINDKARSL